MFKDFCHLGGCRVVSCKFTLLPGYLHGHLKMFLFKAPPHFFCLFLTNS